MFSVDKYTPKLIIKICFTFTSTTKIQIRFCFKGLRWNLFLLFFSPQNGGEDCEGESRGLPRICNVKVRI